MMSNNIDPNALGISFSRKRREISIYRSTIEALGRPCFVRFLFNMEKGRLALQSCEEEELESFVVPPFDDNEWEFLIYSENLIRIIWQRFGWDKNARYHCNGTSYPEYNLVEFDLKQAEIMEAEASD